ncbi:MAG: GyrI-like domain-containing protein [Deltaproteobacteria bacterium]|jgi:hypothetical protein|nr:GyrI-like domain-containing protein [Deltaproteobacteria bacterium]
MPPDVVTGMKPKILIESVEALPSKRLVGYCAILNDKAVGDYYEKLWLNFIDRIRKIPCLANRELYGVCTNLQGNNYFEYWTTVESSPEDQLPGDLVDLPLGGGLYGSPIGRPEISLPSIYSRAFSAWDPPKDYTLEWKLPFFEVYKPNWFRQRALRMCVPLNLSLNQVYHGIFPRGGAAK